MWFRRWLHWMFSLRYRDTLFTRCASRQVQELRCPSSNASVILALDHSKESPEHIFTFIISVLVGALSCSAFSGYVQAHNPFQNDFRVQAYGVAFIAGFLWCRLLLPACVVFAGYLMALVRSSR